MEAKAKRVVIIYTNKLKSVLIDEIELDITAIEDKPIGEAWFEPSNKRDGWKGLIEEIRDIIEDDEISLYFDFNGPEECKNSFGEYLKKYGINTTENKISKKEIAENYFIDAKKYEHRGLKTKAFQFYQYAANYGSMEAQFKVASYYQKSYLERDDTLEVDKETAIATAIEYYEKAANQGQQQAQYSLYEIFSKGEGVNTDEKEAMRWLIQSANIGYYKAQHSLGLCCC